MFHEIAAGRQRGTGFLSLFLLQFFERNKLIRLNGIKDNLSFYETDVSPAAVDYLSKTKATLFDSVINPRPFEYHDRLITLTYENGTRKVSDVEINRYEAIIR